MNRRPSDEKANDEAFFTMKKGKRTSRLKTCKAVNLQLAFFVTPIWPDRIFMYSITPIMLLIARLVSFFEKNILRSEIIVVSLPMVLVFDFICLTL